jgi:hypothetical protein
MINSRDLIAGLCSPAASESSWNFKQRPCACSQLTRITCRNLQKKECNTDPGSSKRITETLHLQTSRASLDEPSINEDIFSYYSMMLCFSDHAAHCKEPDAMHILTPSRQKRSNACQRRSQQACELAPKCDQEA